MPKKDRIKPSLFGLLREVSEEQNNQMAFEYLMSMNLLSSRCDGIVKNLHRLKDFDYRQIPKLYEEAVLVYEFTKKIKVPLHGYQISEATRQRFKSINEADAVYGNKELAMKELSKRYDDSFVLYYIKSSRR
jgi:hypothetical protein